MADSRIMTVVFREKDRIGIERLADGLSTPGNPFYGQHLTRDDLRIFVQLGNAELDEVRKWFTDQGMSIEDEENPNPQRLVVKATPEQIENAFGENPKDWQELEMDVRRAPRIALPGRLDGHVQKISGVVGDLVRGCGRVYGLMDNAADTPQELVTHEQVTTGLTPQDIREIYNFPPLPSRNGRGGPGLDGSGQTIALLMLGGHLEESTLKQFWGAHGVDPPPAVEFVQVGPRNPNRRENRIHDFEAATSVEWAGAMAPGARIVVYSVDPTVFADPWATFFMEIIADKDRAPTVASTSWVTPERDYYRKHGHKVIVGLLAQAACLGITVVSASGDWGPFDGVPGQLRNGRFVADAPWPHGVFPAVEERVLGVGGTMITVRHPLTEVAWSGPLPLGIQPLLPQMRALAGSGGFSDTVPVPAWQEKAFDDYYPRGTGSPAVVPYGRGFPDVALMASGPAIQPKRDDDAMSCLGYQALTTEGWVDYAAGTSVGAPIWAAIVALANEAREKNGLGPLGWANPRLYEAATAEPRAFRPVLNGAADPVMWALNDQGQAVPYHFDGYQCTAGWDPVTGLGVPDVSVLIDHLRADPAQ